MLVVQIHKICESRNGYRKFTVLVIICNFLAYRVILSTLENTRLKILRLLVHGWWSSEPNFAILHFLAGRLYYAVMLTIGLEARFQPNIWFTLRRVLAVFTHSAKIPPKFGWNLEHSWVYSRGLARFWRNLRSSDCWRDR